MKKITLFLCLLLILTGCKKDSYKITIKIPAKTVESFSYAEEEICPKKKKLLIYADAGVTTTEVIIEPVSFEQENTYEPLLLKQNEPVQFVAEEGEWYKIGVNVKNDSNLDIVVSLEVIDVGVRISSNVEYDEDNDIEFVTNTMDINDLSSNKADVSCLIRFDGELYAKSYAMIDYAGGSNLLATINKIVDENIIPSNNNETNRKELLNSIVCDKNDESIIILSDGIYMAFDKIEG